MFLIPLVCELKPILPEIAEIRFRNYGFKERDRFITAERVDNVAGSRLNSSQECSLPTLCTLFAQKLQPKYDQISNGLRCTGDIVAKLFQNEVLNAKERDDIQQVLSTPIRANELLLNILMLKDDRAYSCFLTALSETYQEHIIEILNCEDKSLKSEHSFMIQRNYSKLVEDLDVESGLLLDRLFESGAITTREMATINAKLTKHEKSQELLSLVSKFSSTNFEKLLKALEESSQAHVVSIMTGKFSSMTEINTCTATADESNTQCKETNVKENLQKNLELKGDSNRDLRQDQQQNGRHCAKITKTSSFHVKRQSIKTLGNRFANLPDELQTELSLKVAALHQTTVLPSNVDICFHKLRQGYIQQNKEVYRKQTEVEDMREILRRLNDSEQNSPRQFEDIFQKGIQILKEELLLHRTNNRHLDETLKTRDIALDNATQKIRRIERQLEQCHNELMTFATQRDDLRKKLDSAHQFVDKFKTEMHVLNEELLLHKMNNHHLNETLKASDVELNNEKQKSRGLEKQLEQCHIELMTLERQREELDVALRLRDENKKRLEILLNDEDIEFTDEKEKSSELRTQLHQFQMESAECLKQRDQLHRKLDKQRYRSDPVLVHTIRTKVAEEEKKAIRGLTILDKELFVVHKESSVVEVYDSIKLSFSRQLTLKELNDPCDIVSCNRNKCVYISDYKDFGQSSEILRVDRNGNVIKNWLTGGGYGRLSVTDESTVIFTSYGRNELNEYSSDGQLIREIDLSSAAGIHYPLHAIKLTNGHFLVSHSYYLHRVCIVDSDGKLMKSFGGERGSSIEQMDRPVYLSVDVDGFVMVADQMNHRVLLLDPDLQFKRIILSKEKYGLGYPWRILLDESNGRLFVATDDGSGNAGILIFYL